MVIFLNYWLIQCTFFIYYFILLKYAEFKKNILALCILGTMNAMHIELTSFQTFIRLD